MMFGETCTVFDATDCRRRVIAPVHWEDCEGIVRRKTGEQAADRSILYIPMLSTDAPPRIGDYLVKGKIEAEYQTTKQLLQEQETRRVLSVDARDYGSTRLRHWEVSAR